MNFDYKIAKGTTNRQRRRRRRPSAMGISRAIVVVAARRRVRCRLLRDVRQSLSYQAFEQPKKFSCQINFVARS